MHPGLSLWCIWFRLSSPNYVHGAGGLSYYISFFSLLWLVSSSLLVLPSLSPFPLLQIQGSSVSLQNPWWNLQRRRRWSTRWWCLAMSGTTTITGFVTTPVQILKFFHTSKRKMPTQTVLWKVRRGLIWARVSLRFLKASDFTFLCWRFQLFFFFYCFCVSVEFVDGGMDEFAVEWGEKYLVPVLFALKYVGIEYIGWIKMKIKRWICKNEHCITSYFDRFPQKRKTDSCLILVFNHPLWLHPFFVLSFPFFLLWSGSLLCSFKDETVQWMGLSARACFSILFSAEN